ncbi:TPR repeat-containing thioredoxin TTL1-like protein [Drosera capensis]
MSGGFRRPSGPARSPYPDSSLSDLLNESLICDTNKPDHSTDPVSPVSPLRQTTTTTSSSSSSGSGSGRAGPSPLGTKSHSGELKATRTGSALRRPGHIRSNSSGSVGFRATCASTITTSNCSNSSGGDVGASSSVSSAAGNVLPAGNIIPSGRIPKTGLGLTRDVPRRDVLGSGKGNYGHGSIMRGGGGSSSPGSPNGGSHGGRDEEEGSGGVGDSRVRKGMVLEKMGRWMEAAEEYEVAARVGMGKEVVTGHRMLGTLLLSDGLVFGLIDVFTELCQMQYPMSVNPPKEDILAKCNHLHSCSSSKSGGVFYAGIVRQTSTVKAAVGVVPGVCGGGTALMFEGLPSHGEFGQLGQVQGARKHLGFRGVNPSESELQTLEAIETHLNRCTEASKTGDSKKALKEAEAAINAGAHHCPQLLACRAECLLKLLQLEEADSVLSLMGKSTPTPPCCSDSKFFGMLSEAYPLYVKAQIHLAHGRFGEAALAAQKAAAIDPKNAELTVMVNKVKAVTRARNRGNNLVQSNRLTEARAAYDEGLAFDPFNAVLHCNKAACSYLLKKWEQCVDDCTNALRSSPNYAKALQRRAFSYLKLEKWTHAIQDYEILKRQWPDNKDYAEGLFQAQTALRKSQEGVEEVLDLQQFRIMTSSEGVFVVHFSGTCIDPQSKLVSAIMDLLNSRYPAVTFLKVDVKKCSEISSAENVKTVPMVKIYKNGSTVKELIEPTLEALDALEYEERNVISSTSVLINGIWILFCAHLDILLAQCISVFVLVYVVGIDQLPHALSWKSFHRLGFISYLNLNMTVKLSVS